MSTARTSRRDWPKTKTCANCIFWFIIDREISKGFGQCRRYPPSTAVANPFEGNPFIASHEGWPITRTEQWCGEWSFVDPK